MQADVIQEAKKALDKAKIGLMSREDSVFFATILFSLKQVLTTDIPTLATDGMLLLVNPAFFLSLSPEERISALVHESMHVAYMHMGGRNAGRDKKKWNYAGDYVINQQLHERGFAIGSTWLLDPAYAGMSTEEVYAILPDMPPAMSWEDLLSPQSEHDLKHAVDDILVRARLQSKMGGDKPGTIPGDIEIYLDKILHPKLPWTTILRKYFQNFAKNDYSMRKPNRRFFPDHHLPSLHSESLMDLTFAVDASASVSDAEFEQEVSEIGSVLKMMKPNELTLLQFDVHIRSVEKIHSVQELMKVKFTGRGGTKIRPVLEYAIEHKPRAMLVLSDGDFSWPQMDAPKGTDFIWLVYNNSKFTAPFGKVIHFHM